LREARGDGGEERLHLDLAVGAEACGDAVEVVVVIAGVANEFEGAFGWEGVEDLRERAGVEVAGSGDAYCALRGKHVPVADLKVAVKGGLQAVEKADLEASLEVSVC